MQQQQDPVRSRSHIRATRTPTAKDLQAQAVDLMRQAAGNLTEAVSQHKTACDLLERVLSLQPSISDSWDKYPEALNREQVMEACNLSADLLNSEIKRSEAGARDGIPVKRVASKPLFPKAALRIWLEGKR